MALHIDLLAVVAAVNAEAARVAAGNAMATYVLPRTVRQARCVVYLARTRAGQPTPPEAQALFEGDWARRVPLGNPVLPDAEFRHAPASIFNAWAALMGRPGVTIEN